jgi:hypothetical protein
VISDAKCEQGKMRFPKAEIDSNFIQPDWMNGASGQANFFGTRA